MGCQSNPEAKAIMKSLRRSPSGRGFTHLGSDGVLRTLNGDRKVVDYRQLSPADIDTVLAIWPPNLQAEFREKFQHADGREVTDEEMLWNPGPDILGTQGGEETQ
ncbi:hypothetical protein BJX99DRAFT_226721 [Aspergillus californicus]